MKKNRKRSKVSKHQKRIKRIRFLLKVKLFITVLLPVVFLLLTVKTIKIWLHLMLKSAVLPSENPQPQPEELEKVTLVTYQSEPL